MSPLTNFFPHKNHFTHCNIRPQIEIRLQLIQNLSEILMKFWFQKCANNKPKMAQNRISFLVLRKLIQCCTHSIICLKRLVAIDFLCKATFHIVFYTKRISLEEWCYSLVFPIFLVAIVPFLQCPK